MNQSIANFQLKQQLGVCLFGGKEYALAIQKNLASIISLRALIVEDATQIHQDFDVIVAIIN